MAGATGKGKCIAPLGSDHPCAHREMVWLTNGSGNVVWKLCFALIVSRQTEPCIKRRLIAKVEESPGELTELF